MVQGRMVLSKAYQVTVPSLLRKALNVKPGDEIEYIENANEIVLRRAETKEETVKRIFEELEEMKKEREKQMTPEQKAFAEMTRGWTANQYRQYIGQLPETRAQLKEKYGL